MSDPFQLDSFHRRMHGLPLPRGVARALDEEEILVEVEEPPLLPETRKPGRPRRGLDFGRRAWGSKAEPATNVPLPPWLLGDKTALPKRPPGK